MNNDVSAYGLWPLVIINAGVFIIFAFSFSHPRTARDWRSFGAFSAFLLLTWQITHGNALTTGSTTIDSRIIWSIWRRSDLRKRRKASVGTYYSGKHARSYNAHWHKYSERTLSETVSLIDITALQSIIEQQGRRPRVLDVACGTGILLHSLLQQIPGLDAYGVDGSVDMLAQAHKLLDEYPSVQLQQAVVGSGERANLPYLSHTFDLITYTNALHDAPQPDMTLMGLRQLLAPGGQLIVEDYARRDPPFPWPVFEWLIRWAEKDYVRAYTFSEVQSLCTRAGFRMIYGRTFVVNLLWHGWVLRLGSNTSG